MIDAIIIDDEKNAIITLKNDLQSSGCAGAFEIKLTAYYLPGY
jgi:hypothetical protein